jgi:hypothetical protein
LAVHLICQRDPLGEVDGAHGRIDLALLSRVQEMI